MTTFPVFGCLFCSKPYASESRCGQHLDGFLSDYCLAYTKSATTRRLSNHPVAAIRAMRIHAVRRPGKKHQPVVWDALTVQPADGVQWEFIVQLDSQDDLDAFEARPMKTAEQWLGELRAVPVPVAADVAASDSSSSSSESSSEDEAADFLSAGASPMLHNAHSSPPPTITITPTPAARIPAAPHPTPTPAPRRRRIITGRPRRLVLGQNGIGMSIDTSNVTVEQRHVVAGGAVVVNAQNPVVNNIQRKRRLDDMHGTSSAVTPRRGVEPAAADRITLSAIRRALNPPALVSPNTEMMSRFFTPGNVKPGYFEVKVATTEFRVCVHRETSLCDVVGVVERELLAGEGWPVLLGLCYVGAEEDGVWCEREWEEVKTLGRGRKDGVVEVELVF